MAGPEVLVYGTVCLDRFLLVEADGASQAGAAWVELPGGEAFNTATALAGWGVDVALTGTAPGVEDEGRRLRHLLDTHPLRLMRTWLPQIPEAVTPVCEIRVFPDGERRMTGRGFAQALPPPPLDWPLLGPPRLLAIDPNLGDAAVQTALGAAHAGVEIVAMDFEHPAVIAAATVAVTSHERIDTSPSALARRWRALGARAAIVTQGARGCLVADGQDLYDVPAFAVSPVVDTTGAGDTFRAGLCFGLLRSWPVRRCVEFASAAAALHCTVPGGGSRFSRKKVLALCQNRR